jgi:23S rRNA pseudouridine1911/1915/1917 synthase
VHLAHLGHPLVGDFLYGTESAEISRPALHSAELSLVHPVTGETLGWTSPLPEDMMALLK